MTIARTIHVTTIFSLGLMASLSAGCVADATEPDEDLIADTPTLEAEDWGSNNNLFCYHDGSNPYNGQLRCDFNWPVTGKTVYWRYDFSDTGWVDGWGAINGYYQSGDLVNWYNCLAPTTTTPPSKTIKVEATFPNGTGYSVLTMNCR